MQTPPDIRLITPADDIAELTAMLHRAYLPLLEAGMRYFASHQNEEDTRRRIAGAECWLACMEGRVVGTVALRFPATPDCPWYARPDVAAFGQFGVEPAFQARGIGSRLLDHIEERAIEKGAAELACDTAEPAKHLIAYYARRGFRLIEHTQWKGSNYRSVVLSKRLNGIGSYDGVLRSFPGP